MDRTAGADPDLIRELLADFLTHIEFAHPFEFGLYATTNVFIADADPLGRPVILAEALAGLFATVGLEPPTDVADWLAAHPPADPAA